MCGISGIVRSCSSCPCVGKGSSQSRQKPENKSLSHRGRDGSSTFLSGTNEENSMVQIDFHHLALSDLSASARQPFFSPASSPSEGERWVVACNGEIYNSPELRTLPHCRSWNFQSRSDCEVLLPLLYHHGNRELFQNQEESMISLARQLDGQFAIASCNYSPSTGKLNRAWLFRDAFGIKPLFYAQPCPHSLLFASEAKAMLRVIPNGCEVREVPPGHLVDVSLVTADSNSPSPSLIVRDLTWLESGHQPWIPLSQSDLVPSDAQIAASLRRAVAKRLRADVPVGVFLSGGVDSAIIATLAAEILKEQGSKKKLQTFTVYHANDLDSSSSQDRIFAREIASFIQSDHHEIPFDSETAIGLLPEVISSLENDDMITVRASVPLYLLSRIVRERFGVRCILVGEGADEIFGGYSLFSSFDSSPSSLEGFGAELERRLVAISTSELLRVDRCTMASSVEARLPYLDREFVAMCMHPSLLPLKLSHPSLGRIEKHLLRACFKNQLPDRVLWRRKVQFADGVGKEWKQSLLSFATRSSKAEGERQMYTRILRDQLGPEAINVSRRLSARRKVNRRQISEKMVLNPPDYTTIMEDPELSSLITTNEALDFSKRILHISRPLTAPSLPLLNELISAFLTRVPYHNLTVLLRPRRPPTLQEIREDFLSGLGGPCAVVNSAFAAFLHALGYSVSLTPVTIRQKDNHVGIIVNIHGYVYYVDVGNGKPYFEAASLSTTSDAIVSNQLVRHCPVLGLEGFPWRMRWNDANERFEVIHGRIEGKDKEQVSWGTSPAYSFSPLRTVRYSFFRPSFERSRTDRSYSLFLKTIRVAVYPHGPHHRVAIRGNELFDESGQREAMNTQELLDFASRHFDPAIHAMLSDALKVLNSQGDDLWGSPPSNAPPQWREVWPLESEWASLLSQCLRFAPFSDGNIPGVQRTLSWLSSLLENRGFHIRRFTNENGGADALVAIREPRGSANEWIGLFGHVDVETVKKVVSWKHTSDPMTPQLAQDGRWYCRGVADNLGPLLARVLAFSKDDAQSRGICWTIHGEEEIGSPFAHFFYPSLAEKVPEVKKVDLWVEETGYFNRQGGQRVLVLNANSKPELMTTCLSFLEESCRAVGRGYTVQERAMNKAFGIDRCPCLQHLLGKSNTPYLSIGINDSWSAIHISNESVSRFVLALADRQFRFVMGLETDLSERGGKPVRSVAASFLPLSPPATHAIVVGAGRVGGVFATVLANILPDVQVTALDQNLDLVQSWQRGDAPFLEPDLSLNLSSALERGNLRFIEKIESSFRIKSGDIVFVCVSAPATTKGGSIDVHPILSTMSSIATMADENATITIVNKTTAPVGTAALLLTTLSGLRNDVDWHVVSNPEFLSEGNAVNEIRKPHRVLIGGLASSHTNGSVPKRTPTAAMNGEHGEGGGVQRLRELYQRWVPSDRILPSSAFSAELAKLSSNAMLALRLTAINSISLLAGATTASTDEVIKAVGSDPRIGSQYLKPAFGWGGSCLEKDVKALAFLASELNLNEVADFWKSVVRVNDTTIDHFISLILQRLSRNSSKTETKNVTVLGLSFKSGTGDVRHSAAIRVVERLLNEGLNVHLFDPHVTPKTSGLSHPRINWSDSIPEACQQSVAAIICVEMDGLSSIASPSLRWIFDGRGSLSQPEREVMRKRGIDVIQFGESLAKL